MMKGFIVFCVNFLLAGSGALLTAQLAGAPISANLILTALNIALGASGLYELWGDVVNKQDIAEAQKKGAAAAANPGPTLNG